jgi:hypothetical protein
MSREHYGYISGINVGPAIWLVIVADQFGNHIIPSGPPIMVLREEAERWFKSPQHVLGRRIEYTLFPGMRRMQSVRVIDFS